MRGGCLGVIGFALVVGVFIKYWYIAVPLILVVAVCCWVGAGNEERAKRDAEAALKAEAAERAHQEELKQAQVRYHQQALAAADPVHRDLVMTLAAVPVTRPGDRGRVEQAMAERLVAIDEFARQFAELERTGRPVPDHGRTMQDLVDQERAWDARPGRRRQGDPQAGRSPSVPTAGNELRFSTRQSFGPRRLRSE
ncbi:hypothetical protein EV383_4752 [Pseudonocardia sediminis]|uniref:Uncharacterized protein n=2 Tax=Pseudonocardia sediminis TaxID=1397368 RepID=A0A4Q7V136_PSEST|nr:hypothetical protein EV383_4752 [Pseudonocardia sediminis]